MNNPQTFVKLLILCCFVMLMSGCSHKAISHGTEITQEQIVEIVDGTTSKEDIMIEFGDPSKILNNGNAYFYTWTRGSKGHFLGLGSGNAHTKCLVIIFDDKGIVKNHKITRGSTIQDATIGD